RNVVDNFETAVERSGKSKGFIVGFGFTRDAIEEAARAKRARGLEIVLTSVRALLAPERSSPNADAADLLRQQVVRDLAAGAGLSDASTAASQTSTPADSMKTAGVATGAAERPERAASAGRRGSETTGPG